MVGVVVLVYIFVWSPLQKYKEGTAVAVILAAAVVLSAEAIVTEIGHISRSTSGTKYSRIIVGIRGRSINDSMLDSSQSL